jgi:hypothetical protein
MRFSAFGYVALVAASFVVESAFAQSDDGRVVCSMDPPKAVALSNEGRVGVDKFGNGLSWGEMNDSFFGCGDGRVNMIQGLCAELPWSLFDAIQTWTGRPNQDANVACPAVAHPWLSAIRSDGQFAKRVYYSEKPSEEELEFEPLTYGSFACHRETAYKKICAEFHARKEEFRSRALRQKVATSELERRNLSREIRRLNRENKTLRNRVRRGQIR